MLIAQRAERRGIPGAELIAELDFLHAAMLVAPRARAHPPWLSFDAIMASLR